MDLAWLKNQRFFARCYSLQCQTIQTFHQRAREISGPDCPILPPSPKALTLGANFFSTFFLVVTSRISRSPRFLPLYAMVNQGMRAWVTACDNLLDDEYKEIFPFQISGQGTTVRSVLTLMLAERVVSAYIAEEYADPPGLIQKTGELTYQSLLSSALQECEEEQRPVPVLSVEEVLRTVHQRKTADLFAAPLRLPFELESPTSEQREAARIAVEKFGLGCQILDDIRDLPDDWRAGRHNVVRSILAFSQLSPHTLPPPVDQQQEPWNSWEQFPEAVQQARERAETYFQQSFSALEQLGLDNSRKMQLRLVSLLYRLLKVPA